MAPLIKRILDRIGALRKNHGIYIGVTRVNANVSMAPRLSMLTRNPRFEERYRVQRVYKALCVSIRTAWRNVLSPSRIPSVSGKYSLRTTYILSDSEEGTVSFRA